MKNEKGIIFYLLAVLIFTIAFTGCTGSGKSALVGTWVSRDETRDERKETYVFFKDGSGTYNGRSITWEAKENGDIFINGIYDAKRKYKISGKELALEVNGLYNYYIRK